MAWANLNTLGSTSDKTANQASTTITMGLAAVEAGNVIVLIIAVDNNATTDTDEGAVTSITDTQLNTYSKAKEFTNGQGSAQAGATCSIWYSLITTTIPQTTGVITVNFNNSTSRDASAISTREFSIGAGNVVTVEASNTLANDAADPGSLDTTTSNAAFLRIRGIASETNDTTALTVTTNWTAMTGANTSGNPTASNMGVRGEFRISTGTTDASDPGYVTADHASCYVALKEAAPALSTGVKNSLAMCGCGI